MKENTVYVNKAEPGGERGFVFTSAEETPRQKQQKEIEAFNISEAAAVAGLDHDTPLTNARKVLADDFAPPSGPAHELTHVTQT